MKFWLWLLKLLRGPPAPSNSLHYRGPKSNTKSCESSKSTDNLILSYTYCNLFTSIPTQDDVPRAIVRITPISFESCIQTNGHLPHLRLTVRHE